MLTLPDPDLRAIAPGALHAIDRCAWCGATDALRPATLGLTRAPAVVCEDAVACVRRQLHQKAAA